MKRLLLVLLLLLPLPCFSLPVFTCCIDKNGVPLSTPASHVGVAFSPDRGATALIVRTIESAHKCVRVAAYSFTSKPIAQALLEAHKRGTDVRVVVVKSNATARYTAATFLANQGVPVRVVYRYAIIHDKFIVLDG